MKQKEYSSGRKKMIAHRSQTFKKKMMSKKKHKHLGKYKYMLTNKTVIVFS